jgi:phosphate transport system permease protein
MPADVLGKNLGDRLWAIATTAVGGSILIIAGIIVVSLGHAAWPAYHEMGWQLVIGRDWDPVAGVFGALPFIYGTVVTSALAMVLAVPVGLGLALFLAEMAPRQVRPVVSFAIETLAAVPSVIYGLWAFFVMVPWLRETVEPFLGKHLGFLPLFQGPPLGLGYLAAGLLLAIMVLPTLASVSLEVLKTVPLPLKEGAYALGATRWEAIRLAVLPYSWPGIFGAGLLALGRALGETMAVTMVIGNAPEIHASLFAPGYSLPAVIANEFAEATGDLHLGALAGLGLILFGMTLLLNSMARVLLRSVRRKA